jgi:hypothetical protein
VADLVADGQQQPTRLLGQFGGQLGVGKAHPASIADSGRGLPYTPRRVAGR